ncbi:unnamed protein product, partial [Protopolystoma xenopodis]
MLMLMLMLMIMRLGECVRRMRASAAGLTGGLLCVGRREAERRDGKRPPRPRGEGHGEWRWRWWWWWWWWWCVCVKGGR